MKDMIHEALESGGRITQDKGYENPSLESIETER